MDNARDSAETPLNAYQKTAPSAFMREVAEIASRRHLKQQTLADQFGTEPANIMRHFKSYSPQKKTIQKYADLLQMPPIYVKLVQGGKLNDDERHDAWQQLDRQLQSAARDLGEETIAALRDRFEKLDPNSRGALLESFQLEDLRRVAYYPGGWLVEWRSVSPALRDVAKKLLNMDLQPVGSVSDPKERFLLDLWILLTGNNILAVKEAQHLLDTARYMLTTKDVNLVAMEIRLEEDKLYYGSMVNQADLMRGTVNAPKKGKDEKRCAK